MSYTTDDFSESLSRVGIGPDQIEAVVAAWGKGDGMGEDAGHYLWSEDGATEWSGGFLFRLKDGRYAYVTGWCDFTGWGCQDGAVIGHFDHEPTVREMRNAPWNDDKREPDAAEWDLDPADLNKWLRAGAPGL